MHQPGESSQLATALRDFMKLESAGGILLLIAAIAAMLVANSPLASLYDALLDTTVAVQVGAFVINKPLLLWINDGLMAVFFFLIGLEIKREIMEGELSSLDQVILPGMGALGGMAMMGRRQEPKPGQMLLGAIAEGPDANWFFKLTGPEATLEAQREAFEGMILSLRRGE